MKKALLIPVLVFGFALFSMSTMVAQAASDDLAMTVEVQDEFEKISTDELPDAIKEACKRDFAGATVSEVYKNKKGLYKLVISVGEKTTTVFANKNGEWIQKDEN